VASREEGHPHIPAAITRQTSIGQSVAQMTGTRNAKSYPLRKPNKIDPYQNYKRSESAGGTERILRRLSGAKNSWALRKEEELTRKKPMGPERIEKTPAGAARKWGPEKCREKRDILRGS